MTFLWIGLLILKDPIAWGGYIGAWLLPYLPTSVREVMITTAFFDLVVGLWLLLDYKIWIPASLGTLHLATVIIVSGINAITVRDIGIFSACLALTFETAPFLKEVSREK